MDYLEHSGNGAKKQSEPLENVLSAYRKLELLIYFTVYIGYLLYGLNTLLGIRNKILEIAAYPFIVGWPLIDRPRDDSNDELENFTHFIYRRWHWYILHLLTSMALRMHLLQRPSLAHTIVSLLFLCSEFHRISVATICFLLYTYYIASKQNSKSIVWTLSILWIMIINFLKNSDAAFELLGYEEYVLLIVLLSWTMLRCCSFALNRIIDKASHSTKVAEQIYSLEHYLGYTMYFPTLIHGPFLGFRRYIVIEKTTTTHIKMQELYSHLWLLLMELMRVFFWWFFINFSLHFLYIHYMERDIKTIRLVKSSYSQYAIVYFMGQFFFMYYVVTYGLGIAIANFDGLQPPKRPRCIGRIHFYSDMWKFFDEGLYEFLFQHIYAELCHRNSHFWRKLLATIATFAFIFVWHGCYDYVLIWSVLNFVCLVAEKLFKRITSSYKYYKWITLPLGPDNSQRLRALLATQIFIPAAYSNVYFISGNSIGHLLMSGVYRSGPLNYLVLTFCSYCFVQCSEIISKFKDTERKMTHLSS